jgi:oligopeptide transport system permease protein
MPSSVNKKVLIEIVVHQIFFRLSALFIVITLTFFLMQALPGDPFHQEQALPEAIHQALRSHFGLDDPWAHQYLRYLKGILFGDLGPSFRYVDRTVNQIIAEGFPVSAVLGGEALLLALSMGIFLGMACALKRQKWQDKLILLFAALTISIPSFLLGSLLQYYFGLKWGLFPIARWGCWLQTVLPALSLAALPAAYITRLVRTSLIEALHQGYMRTAKAKGLSDWKMIAKHGLRNALLPVLSYLGPLTANILVGSFVIEKIYAIPGLGQFFVNSILNRDYTAIMGLTVFYSTLLLFTVLCVDILYGWIDPRIRNYE